MKLSVNKLIVKYNGSIVGRLVATNDEITFQYDESWLENGFSISPLSLHLSNKKFTQKKWTFAGLFGVFNDSLPDGWGALIITKKLMKMGINYENLSPLTKLSLTNNLSLGALTYEPQELADEDCKILHSIDELYNDIQLLYDENIDVNLFDEIVSLASSSAGSRPKINVNINGDYWIIKFKSFLDSKNIGKEEYEANELARKCGINTNEFKLFDSNICSGYFGCKRFDRIGEKRIHMIYLSSILETSYKLPNLDYIHLIKVTKLICVNPDDVYEVYRRMVFNVFYGNKDDHGNNFAFIYDEDLKGYKLSPFYDITKTTYLAEHNMSINGNPNPTEDDLVEVAKQTHLDLSTCKNIISDIKKVLLK